MQIFNALSDKTRYKLLEILTQKEKPICICEIKEKFDQDTSVLYRHIKKLERANLIQTEKEGRKLLCSTSSNDKIKKLLNIVEEIKNESSNTRERMPKVSKT